MRFLILRLLTHSELGMFHEYRRSGREGSKQRAINFDGAVVDRVFPAARDSDRIEMDLLQDTDSGVARKGQWLKRQEKNWRLEGSCPKDKCYHFVEPGCLFALEIDAGASPASGAWAVFAADSRATTAILADGESSMLTSSGMIALHEEEADRTWQVLKEERPDLFSGPKRTRLKTGIAPASVAAGVELPPDPARLVQILASVGHTLPSAVADLVDNAISAEATEIAITFNRPDSGHGRWMSIVDNGKGMDAARLAEAMRIGSNSHYEETSLGKYGFGLKGASWSQSKAFTVVSKCTGMPCHHLTWDVEDMDGWIAKSNPLEPWEAEATAIGSHGTAVLWKDMRPPLSSPMIRGLDPYSAEVMHLERHLALVFHRFLEGKAAGRKKVTITVNGNHVQPNNPVGHPLVTPYDAKSIRIATEGEDGRVLVQAFLLPTEDEIREHHRNQGSDAAARALDLIGLHGKRNETQGLFIYRHDRLIKWGGWHQMWETNDEKTKLARVAVNFDRVLDDAFKINISKQLVQLPQQLQAAIKKLADVARKDSQRKYRKESRQAPLPALGGATAGSVAGGKGGAAGSEPMPAPAAGWQPGSSPAPREPSPQIALRSVITDKFLWKLTKGMTGALDLQVSGLNASLAALTKQIRSDACAVAHLAEFLQCLDAVDAQQQIMQRKSG